MSLTVICGATATGKSELAVALAKEINADVINADSMQVYKGMDIGTAKLTITQRDGVMHHLIDVLDISEEANVSWYQQLARDKIDELISLAIVSYQWYSGNTNLPISGATTNTLSLTNVQLSDSGKTFYVILTAPNAVQRTSRYGLLTVQ